MELRHNRLWIRWMTAAATGIFLLLGSGLAARQKHRPHPAQKHTIHRKVQSADKPVKRRIFHHYTAHHSTYSRHHHTTYHRRARVRLQPDRIKEIQQALGKAGFLQEDPTGRWDSATRGAMRQYQQANGFSVTGLPEAKPLMKLGLGPHPLPPGLQPLPPGNSTIQGDAESSALSAPAPVANSQGQAQ